MARMDIISGIERRRRWPLEVKLSILAQAAQPRARVCDVARRHDVHPSLMIPTCGVAAGIKDKVRRRNSFGLQFVSRLKNLLKWVAS